MDVKKKPHKNVKNAINLSQVHVFFPVNIRLKGTIDSPVSQRKLSYISSEIFAASTVTSRV